MKYLAPILILLAPMAAAAQTICPPQDYDSETEPNFDCPSPSEESMIPRLSPPPSIPVEVGDVVEAQWEGAVVHRDRLVRMGLTITALRRLRWADRLRLRAEFQIRLEHQDEVCDANLEHAQAETEVYQEALQLANERVESSQAWYRSWWFGFTLGVVAAGALVALTAYALSAVP